jgi:hypothetical protein
MYYSRFRKEVDSDSKVGILNSANIFLDISHYMSVNDVGKMLKFGPLGKNNNFGYKYLI